jgi:hypothetical protein
MKRILRQQLIENLIYLVIWLLIFLAPVMSALLAPNNMVKDAGMWSMAWNFWLEVIPFFVLFLFNNYLLAPQFLLRKRYFPYVVIVLLLFVGIYFHSIYARRYMHNRMMTRERMEMRDHHGRMRDSANNMAVMYPDSSRQMSPEANNAVAVREAVPAQKVQPVQKTKAPTGIKGRRDDGRRPNDKGNPGDFGPSDGPNGQGGFGEAPPPDDMEIPDGKNAYKEDNYADNKSETGPQPPSTGDEVGSESQNETANGVKPQMDGRKMRGPRPEMPKGAAPQRNSNQSVQTSVVQQTEKTAQTMTSQDNTPQNDNRRQKGNFDNPPAKPNGDFRPGPPDDMRGGGPQPPFGSFLHVVIAFLLIGFNTAVKLFFRSMHDQERMQELERQRLETEMQYLRYQINPHFLMNTLNNIHALVDIEPEKAQETIRDLSKLMRYVLYEAGNKTVPLTREIDFINNYISLMRLHYSEKVDMSIDVPSVVPEVQVPPLLFISFIENAFKHGVSYRERSFVDISMRLDDQNRISFRCRNSNHDKQDDNHHGIGVENVRKRLELMFPGRYTLSINKDEKIYEVLVIIPLQS